MKSDWIRLEVKVFEIDEKLLSHPMADFERRNTRQIPVKTKQNRLRPGANPIKLFTL